PVHRGMVRPCRAALEALPAVPRMLLQPAELSAAFDVEDRAARFPEARISEDLRRLSLRQRLTTRPIARRAMPLREVHGGVDERHVRERLREVAELALRHRIVFLGEQSDVVS